MEWYEWVMMFGGTGLVGLIIADIYLFFKWGVKRQWRSTKKKRNWNRKN